MDGVITYRLMYVHVFPTLVRNTMLPAILLILFLFAVSILKAQSTYYIDTVFYLPYKGEWKHPTVNPSSNKLYITHGNQVSIVNKNTGDSLGIIPNTPGVKSVALAPKYGKGYTTNSQSNSVTVFDLKSDRYVKDIPVGLSPAWIIYDVFSSKIVVSNQKEGVHLADKREVVWVNMSTYEVEMHWNLGTGKSPAGMAIDTKYKRLFSVCNKLLIILDITTSKIVDSLEIGENPDGIVFDPINKLLFIANGNGSLSVISQLAPNDYSLVQNIPTKKGSNSIAFDETTSALYLPGADQYTPTKPTVKQVTPSATRWIPSSFQVMVLEKSGDRSIEKLP